MSETKFPDLAASFSLEGKVAVITGAGSGIGRETARVFSAAGATVVLADIDEAKLAESGQLVEETGGTAHIQRCDVADPDSIQALADKAVRDCEALDCWINAAGISLWSEVLDVAREEAERVIAVNMMGTYWCCAAAGRAMKELGRGGTIVNVSSTAGDNPVPMLSVYGMAKAGVNQLTRVCAKEFGPFGVRVNAVVPGWIDTPMNSSMYRDASGEIDLQKREEVLEQMAAMTSLRTTGEAYDISMGFLYLASEASRFVTGHMLRVSGGV